MPRYRLEIEYIGKEFAGSQCQRTNKDEPRTIQSEVQKALSTLIKKETKTIFSGRTDAGVNAGGMKYAPAARISGGQVLHFDCSKRLVASEFVNSMNGILPKDISVKNLEEVQDDFHAQMSAKWRWYRYILVNRNQRSAFDGDLLLVRHGLNLENMKCALKLIEGEHDFSSFKSTGTNTPTDICNILCTNVQKRRDEIIIDIVGNRFLYNMVRTIVGTLLMLEKNSLPPKRILEILNSKQRKNAGPTINPYGLTLMKVGYEPFREIDIK